MWSHLGFCAIEAVLCAAMVFLASDNQFPRWFRVSSGLLAIGNFAFAVKYAYMAFV